MASVISTVSTAAGRKIVKFMEMAALMAMQSPMKFKHGAVLVKFGRTIGTGFNYDRVRFRGKDITSVHAEINALDGKTLATASGTLYGVI
jgi:deoxycytidylate deaminase